MRPIKLFISAQLLIMLAARFSNVAASDGSHKLSAEHNFPSNSLPFILDMVHNNPGEARYQTEFTNPEFVASMGYNGKVYFLFDSPTLAVDWQSVDPDIFPAGSPGRKWVDAAAARIDQEEAACHAAGLKVYAMSDLILFPRPLVEKYGINKTFGDPQNPQTQQFLKALLDQIFTRFPKLDGLVVRIGETYLQDAPYHVGKIERKTDADATIIPLIQLLRQEVCVKRQKQIIFRTWISCDTDLATYLKVTKAIQPHTNLVFSVKHCEGDFHRPNVFSKILGQGGQPQIVEVQCAREYEGKGAYPNYVANAVIEGFEENRNMASDSIKSLREFHERGTNFFGVWTWSRGGGWQGPYIQNELWCELNAWVMAEWANHPDETEEAIFNKFAAAKLHLRGVDLEKFRQLCLLSAQAVLLGKNTSQNNCVDRFWSRDEYIAGPELPKNSEQAAFIISQRAESVKVWEQIVEIAGQIHFDDAKLADFVVGSCKYGECVYRIYLLATQLAQAEYGGKKLELRKLLAEYDRVWAEYRALPSQHAQTATLYQARKSPWQKTGRDLNALVEACREQAR